MWIFNDFLSIYLYRKILFLLALILIKCMIRQSLKLENKGPEKSRKALAELRITRKSRKLYKLLGWWRYANAQEKCILNEKRTEKPDSRINENMMFMKHCLFFMSFKRIWLTFCNSSSLCKNYLQMTLSLQCWISVSSTKWEKFKCKKWSQEQLQNAWHLRVSGFWEEIGGV